MISVMCLSLILLKGGLSVTLKSAIGIWGLSITTGLSCIQWKASNQQGRPTVGLRQWASVLRRASTNRYGAKSRSIYTAVNCSEHCCDFTDDGRNTNDRLLTQEHKIRSNIEQDKTGRHMDPTYQN